MENKIERVRRNFLIDIADAFSMMIATYLALYIRDAHFVTSEEATIFPALSAFATFLIFHFSGTNKHLIRYFSLREFLSLTAGMGLAVGAAALLAFLAFRLNDIPRGVPILQWLIAVGLSSGLRLAYRLWHGSRQFRVQQPRRIPLLIVGNTPAAEILLRLVETLGRDRYQIIGILDEDHRLYGSRLRGCEILGHPKDLSSILLRLRTHGITVRHVLLACPQDSLSSSTLQTFKKLIHTGLIEVEDIQKKLLQLLPNQDLQDSISPSNLKDPCKTLSKSVLVEMEARLRTYGPRKRAFDVIGAIFLGVLAAPIIPVILLMLWGSLGRPFLFWQERVGKDGKMVRIYKFRTMHMPREQDVDDTARQSRVGNLLRRLHLDELPQLYNILKGDMSFIGPRPLLPVDLPVNMPECLRLRALLRPGLTGWAQINGGKSVSKEDKVILDIWYLKNMSLKLDLIILYKTFLSIIRGEKLLDENINKAYADLGLQRKSKDQTSVSQSSMNNQA